MNSSIVGRDAVLDRAWQALGAGGIFAAEGPAGIGKTAVWRALVAEAGRRGWLVLSCAPAEIEAGLPFAALADLLRPLASAVVDLPGPQRVAAGMVLLSESDHVVDERAVSAATRALLELAVARHGAHVLLAVDDAQWLDRPSERAIRFALRRTAPMATLVTFRTGEAAPDVAPLGLDAGLLRDRLTRIGIGPLGVGPLHHILRAQLNTTLSRPLLARIAQESGGNPLLAIELARAVLRLPQPPQSGQDLPVAFSFHHLVLGTLASLPPESRRAVRLAALLAVSTLADLAGAGVSPSDLDPAEEAGLVVVTPSRVEFTHPAYAAAVRSATPPGVRRRLHGVLAGVVIDRDERVRHLAQCTVEPDPVVAQELAQAAARYRSRGAPGLAAELYQRARDLTPAAAVADLGTLRLAIVRCLIDSGDYMAALSAAEAAIAELTGDQLAEALLLRAIVCWHADVAQDQVAETAERALAAATPGSPLAGRIHAHLAMFHDFPESARSHAAAAIRLLGGRAEDRGLCSSAMFLLLFNEVRSGLPARTELLEAGLALESGEPSWVGGSVPAIWWKGIDEHDRARERLREMLRQAGERGDEPLQHELLTHLGEMELLAGRWHTADQHIAAARELGEQLGTELLEENWLSGLLAAHRGRLAEAERVAQEGLQRAATLGDIWARRIHLQLAGFVALSAGRMRQAADAYGELAAVTDAMGLAEPLPLRFEPDWIEACVGIGDLQTAALVLDRLALRHHRLPRPWTTLGLARSRLLIGAATGADTTTAIAELIAARAATPADVLPLDRARCLLLAGVVHRRARRKRQAREALCAAIEELTAIGAQAFAERAAAELSRVAGAGQRSALDLTPTEDRVARLAAQGCSNRVIADTMFLSPKTVEANLARIYRKLGISSRAELGAAMVHRPPLNE